MKIEPRKNVKQQQPENKRQSATDNNLAFDQSQSSSFFQCPHCSENIIKEHIEEHINNSHPKRKKQKKKSRMSMTGAPQRFWGWDGMSNNAKKYRKKPTQPELAKPKSLNRIKRIAKQSKGKIQIKSQQAYQQQQNSTRPLVKPKGRPRKVLIKTKNVDQGQRDRQVVNKYQAREQGMDEQENRPQEKQKTVSIPIKKQPKLEHSYQQIEHNRSSEFSQQSQSDSQISMSHQQQVQQPQQPQHQQQYQSSQQPDSDSDSFSYSSSQNSSSSQSRSIKHKLVRKKYNRLKSKNLDLKKRLERHKEYSKIIQSQLIKLRNVIKQFQKNNKSDLFQNANPSNDKENRNMEVNQAERQRKSAQSLSSPRISTEQRPDSPEPINPKLQDNPISPMKIQSSTSFLNTYVPVHSNSTQMLRYIHENRDTMTLEQLKFVQDYVVGKQIENNSDNDQ